MKSFILLSFLFIGQLIGFGQSHTTLEFNNVRAYLSTDGHFFNNPTGVGGYEVPRVFVNPTSAIFSNTFWFGGPDINGSVKLAGQKHPDGSFQDYYPGPLSTFGGVAGQYGDANITQVQMAQYDQIWTISKGEIQHHIQNYNTMGYTPISMIASWPAHGDPTLGEAYYLAPFVDVNNDGHYDPMDGDYPEIRGDQAAYMILNDKGGLHFGSLSDPIGLELHIMTYQFASSTFDTYIDNTTFVNIRFINRSTQSIGDFKFSNFLDADIGNGVDDYMGTLPSKNLVYGYNGNNIDSQYGPGPPAIGVMTLCQPIESSCYFNDNSSFAQMPNIGPEFYGYMDAKWGNSGSAFTYGGNGYGGTNPTQFLYDDFTNWSEISEGNPPGDRRMLLTTSPGLADGSIRPGFQGNIDLAFIYARDTTYTASVDSLFVVADSVQTFFDNRITGTCQSGYLTLPEQQTEDVNVQVYPNPTHSKFMIEAPGVFDMEIYDISGKLISKANGVLPNQSIEAPEQTGIYLVKIILNNDSTSQKLIVK